MTTKLRMLFAGVTMLGVCALVCTSSPSYAGGEKDLKAAVMKIAAAIKKGDAEGAKKMAKDTAKGIEDLADLMHLFRPRNKGGLGVGSKTFGTNPAKDGIEVMIRDYARDTPAAAAKFADALEETGYWIAAMGEVTAAKGWPKDQGKKTKKNWTTWSEEMRSAGIEFAKASAGKGGAAIKGAATKVNNNCNACHSVFKE